MVTRGLGSGVGCHKAGLVDADFEPMSPSSMDDAGMSGVTAAALASDLVLLSLELEGSGSADFGACGRTGVK